MSHKTFKGGVHPPDSKLLTKDKPIVEAPPPSLVIIPLGQHIGRPAIPIVKKKDIVKVGQLIGKAADGLSASVHSSISGEVIAVSTYPDMFGKFSLAIEIRNDDKDEWIDDFSEREDWQSLDIEEMKKRIADAGIVGLGGATFPVEYKIKFSPPVDYIILNGAECEPYLTADHRLMLEDSKSIVEGLKILMKILNAKQGLIGIEDNKMNAVEAMTKAAEGHSDVEVITLHVKYPQGAEKQLIKAATGLETPPNTVDGLGLPGNVGCYVQNVATASAIYDAVTLKKPLVSRITTVTGAIKNPQNFHIRIGTKFSALIEAAGGYDGKPGKLIAGGPMMGMAQYTDEIPAIKGTSGILVFPEDMASLGEEGPCIGCSRCIDGCPMNLMPTLLATYVRANRWDLAEEADIMACIKCGSCSYTCPAKIPLYHYILYGQTTIMGIVRERKAKK